MSNLDQFFKDKFQDREFEFKEDYWDQAQKLIADDENNRRKGLWFRRFGWGLLLLIFVGAGTSYFFFKSNIDPITQKETITNPSTYSTTQEKEVNSSTSSNIEVANQNAEKETNAEIETKSSKKNGEGTNSNNPSSVERSNGEINSVTDNIKTPKGRTIFESNNIANATPSSEKNTTFTERSNPLPTSSGNILTPDIEAIDKANASNILGENLENQRSITTSSKTGTLTLSKSVPTNNDKASLEDQLVLTNLVAIETKAILPLNEPEKEEVLKRKDFTEKELKWQFGFHANAHFYPANTEESLWIGGAAGISARYLINRKIAIQSDLSYGVRRGNFSSIDTLLQQEYSFGLRETEYFFRPVSMHTLELPIYLQWTNKRQIVEGGLHFSYLLNVKGKVSERSSLYPWELKEGADPKDSTQRWGEEMTTSSGTLETKKFNTFIPALLLGYRYRVNPNFTANFQVKYNLQPIVVNNETEVLKESGPLRFSLGLTYFPFGKSRNK